MAEALAQVKRHFGRDAVILSTRSVPRKRLLGHRGRSSIEITAAQSVADLPPGVRGIGAEGRQNARESVSSHQPAKIAAAEANANDSLLGELGSLRGMVYELVRETHRSRIGGAPPPLFEMYLALVQNEVAERIAEQLIDRVRKELPEEKLGEPEKVRARLAAAVEEMLPTAGPVRVPASGKPVIVALVGPTGVGKTTTAAKLAANFQLREHKRVGLITIDTYRIAAVEQLRTYADIINIPLEVVMTPDQLREAVGRLSDRDVILLDTAGRSQRDAVKILQLKQFFAAVRPHEVHLVLAGTAAEAVLHETIERFRDVGIDRVIFTKLDEALGFGVMLSCLSKAEARLSYVTTGQDVPDAIAVAESKRLARLILEKKRQ